jgi:hypothetical protein
MIEEREKYLHYMPASFTENNMFSFPLPSFSGVQINVSFEPEKRLFAC